MSAVNIKQRLGDLLGQAVKSAQASGKLLSVTVPENTIERPQNPEHGDYATSLPLKLARVVGQPPLSIAREIVNFIPSSPELASVVAAPPGFINFKLSDKWLAGQVDDILTAGNKFGNIDIGKGSKVQVEFVSVNPTGPLHVGHGRGAVLGSCLSSVLAAAGYNVTREYYLNDTGNQIEAFKRSFFARYQQQFGREAEVPADGYHGAYLVDYAKEVAAREGKRFLEMPEPEALREIGKIGLDMVVSEIKTDLDRLGVSFDVWFSEQSLYDSGLARKVMAQLQKEGHLALKEGATWFISTALGEDKDNVVVRGDGSPTYFASDIAYHYNKFFERKFDRVINIWGADHQGHVSRMKAVIGALGIDSERLTVLICQMVSLKRGEETVRVSKRSGDIITLRELIDEVGADACRYFFAARSADSQMDFDLELAKEQSPENPVYYVQYGHARICSVLKHAKEKGISYEGGDVSLLVTAPELNLIRKMLLLPETVETAAKALEPHHMAYYALDLATVFHSFYDTTRVVTDDASLTKARLKLVAAGQVVLARTLHLMGMNAPESM
ncbi:MAG: arginine--tRNA ligase [Dehalococcoidia bacterium]|nr:MAG: arginine--tRNA ligase [Dehalococcoidia bacterium]